MNDDLDAMFARLARQPLPLRLQGIDAKVQRSLQDVRGPVAARSWRYAAVSLALVTGMGVGGSAAALRERPAVADLSGGVRLAPSSLLGASL